MVSSSVRGSVGVGVAPTGRSFEVLSSSLAGLYMCSLLSLYGIWDKLRFSAVYFGFLNHLLLDIFFFRYSFLCYSHSYLYQINIFSINT
jgi:hypothetical protein